MKILEKLIELNSPAAYEPGEPMFWTDPHISKQMLEAHLDQSTENASYTYEHIDAICGYLQQQLKLKAGDRVVDLGCGPGLYSARLADRGLAVTGIDFSPTAIGYAREQTAGKLNKPEFRVGNYLDWHESAAYDAALLIYEDYGVLSPVERRALLANIHRALADGGVFVLDVASLGAFETRKQRPDRSWHKSLSGFWRPHPHLVLEEHFRYEDIPAMCDQYVVCDDDVKVYRVYQTYYSPESIAHELELGGFAVENTLASLTGEAWAEGSAQIGIICRKK